LLEHHVPQESFAGHRVGGRWAARIFWEERWVLGKARAEVKLDGRIGLQLHYLCLDQLSDSLLFDCVCYWQL